MSQEESKAAALQMPDGTYNFSLSSYDAVELSLPRPQITEDDIRQYLEMFMYKHADIVPIEEERKPKPGDIVTIDLETFEGEQKIGAVSGNNLKLELGANLMPPVFEDAVCQMNTGDSAEIEYEIAQDKSLKSKVTLHDINTRIIPALTDAWVKENLDGYQSCQEFTAGVHTQLIQQKEAELEAQKAALIADALADRLEQAIPQELIDEAYESFKQNFDAMLQMQGSSRAQFMALQGVDEKVLEESERKEAELGLKRGLALDAYAKHHKLSVDDKDVPGLLGVQEEAAQQFEEALRKDGSFAEARTSALRNKALQELSKQSKINFAD